MTVKCGWAAQSETGTAFGRPGDQTGREVLTGNWYRFGQTVCLRWKDRALAEKAARYWTALCGSPLIGYSQADRTSADTELAKVDYMLKDLHKKVNLDCSSGMALVVRAMLRKIDRKNMPPAILWTGNMKKALLATGYFTEMRGGHYGLTSDTYVRVGDILLNEQTHVIMALEDGAGTKEYDMAKSKTTVKKAPAKDTSYKVQVVVPVLNVRDRAGTQYKVNTQVKMGEVYTITESKSGWGKLKSGAGWIYLAYTKRV